MLLIARARVLHSALENRDYRKVKETGRDCHNLCEAVITRYKIQK